MNTPANATTARTPLRVHVRPMIWCDVDEVHAIERASFDHPWTEEETLAVLGQRNHIGVVAQYGERLLGFAIFDLGCGSIAVLDFAVLPAARGRGVGRQLMEQIIGRLSEDRRTRIIVDVRESNLAAQLFLHALGFRAVEIRGGLFPPDGEEAYRFMYSIRDACSGR